MAGTIILHLPFACGPVFACLSQVDAPPPILYFFGHLYLPPEACHCLTVPRAICRRLQGGVHWEDVAP